MKKTRLILAAVLTTIAIPILCLSPGCVTSYKAEKAADITVSAAMTAWGDYVAKNHPPVSQELQVRAAFRRYQAAEILAIDATKGIFDLNSTNSDGTNSIDAATAQLMVKARVQAATSAASAAFADLVGLLTSFGVKISK